MLSLLENLDRFLFNRINQDWTHPFLDQWMPLVTDLHKQKWLPYFLIVAVILPWIFLKRKRGFKVLCGLALCVGLVDQITAEVLKPTFLRDRPSASVEEARVLIKGSTPTGRSFPSNHAANTFAAAGFLFFIHSSTGWLLFPFASLVAFSRVYVGVHFPLDVTVGALWGLLFSWFFFLVWKRVFLYKKV